jgi:hypothetical protein
MPQLWLRFFSRLQPEPSSTEQTWKVALQQGLKISKNNFGVSTRNPVHYGGILIPPYQEKVSNFGKGNTR